MDEGETVIMKFSTKAIHTGYHPDPQTGAIMPPIYMTSTYVQEAPGKHKGYEYTRAQNPNFEILEELLASLENAKYATVFSSGLGALTAMISTLKPGDRIIAIDGVYGGTYRLFTKVFSQYNIQFISTTADQLENELSKGAKWLFFESPTNPLLECFDIKSLAQLAKQHGALSIVDNTFATPYFQNPLDFGVDVVWHSMTKYIGGHSDVIGGVVMTNHEDFQNEMHFKRMAIGVNPSPFDTWLTTRGVKTLALRMEKHQSNALTIAKYFEQHPKVKKVFYPGLNSHKDHPIASKQMRGFSGIVSVEFDLDLEKAKKLISSFRYFSLAESLGGIESMVNHPATMTHASIPPEERKRIGLSDGLIRFSVGIEDPEDLLDDLKNTLSK